MKNPQITCKVYYMAFFDRDGFLNCSEPYSSLKDKSLKAFVSALIKAKEQNVRIGKIYEFTEIVKTFK